MNFAADPLPMTAVKIKRKEMTAFIVSMRVGQDRPGGEVQARNSFRNLAALPRFQRLCDRYGVMPVYLLTYPVLQAPITQWLQGQADIGACEIGICLQPWTTPPFETNENRLTATPLSEIGGSRIHNKLETLVDTFVRTFGRAPLVHRGDGPDMSSACLQGLENLGIGIDTSAKPGCYDVLSGQTDWRQAPKVPYFPSRQDPASRGGSPVVEIPITTGVSWASAPHVHRPLGLLRRSIESTAISRILEESIFSAGTPRPLDPTVLPFAQLRDLTDQAVRMQLPHINAALRSECLAAGESEVNKDAQAIEQVFDAIDSLFRYAIDTLRLKPVKMSVMGRQHAAPSSAD